MASMTRTTPTSLPRRLPRQAAALPLLLLLVVGLAVAAIALVAVPRPSPVPVAPAPAGSTAAAMIALHDDLHLQRLAAEQALRAGQTENYEIAVSGAEALHRRIGDLRARQPAMTDLDREIVDAYELLHAQRLAAEHARRAGQTENYEIAVSGAEAVQSRIVDLRARRPRD
jgi:hypothetical protein